MNHREVEQGDTFNVYAKERIFAKLEQIKSNQSEGVFHLRVSSVEETKGRSLQQNEVAGSNKEEGIVRKIRSCRAIQSLLPFWGFFFFLPCFLPFPPYLPPHPSSSRFLFFLLFSPTTTSPPFLSDKKDLGTSHSCQATRFSSQLTSKPGPALAAANI